ncbi:protein phosphatase 2C domain-containing protein [Thermodesulfobacteriota bacterium]
MVVVESAGITDVGMKRTGNEDSLFVDDDLKLYVVADGMGGHKAGEVASKMVVDTLRDHFKGKAGGAEDEVLFDAEKDLSDTANHLVYGIRLANKEIFQLSEKNEAVRGMGSTVSAILVTEEVLISSNVGDSPIYLIRDNAIEDLYEPHTMIAEYERLAPEGAKPLEDKYKHVLTRAMGVDATVQPGVTEISYAAGDMLVISSDGLTDNVNPKEILEIVKKGSSVQEACQSLVDLSNERGGHDNITVIVLSISGAEDEAVSPAVEVDDVEPDEEPVPEGELIAVDYDTDEVSQRGYIRNLSLEGCHIESHESLTVGEEIMITFSMGEGHDPFMITGEVTSRDPKGIDVKFEELSESQKEQIQSLI